MTLLEHGQPADTPTRKHRTGLISVVAILAVALLAVGGWLIVDRQQQPTEQQPLSTVQQRGILTVVNAYRDAIYAGDRDALLATLTSDATLTHPDGDPVIQRDDFAGWESSNRLSWTGAPVFYGDLQVAIPARLEFPGLTAKAEPQQDPWDVTYFFTLRQVDGQLKIATIVKSSKVYWYPDLDGGWSPR